MPEKDGSLGLGGLSSALGNGTPAFHRSSHTAMITTGSGRATDNPASMSTTGDGTRALQGGVRGSRSNTTATADAAMRANRRNGNLTNSGALRAANGFATVAAKLETAINRQSAMIEKQTDQIIVRLETLNKTMASMSEMYQKVNNVALSAYEEQIKAQQRTFSNFFSKIFRKDYFGYVDKLSVPWSRQNSNALNVTIPRAIAQFDKNFRVVSSIMTIKMDKFETIFTEQLVETYRHNSINEELLADISNKFNVYFKTSSSQRQAIGLSANHIQNTADHFFLNTNVYRERLTKELSKMTNHVVNQFVTIMDNVTKQLSETANYIVDEIGPPKQNRTKLASKAMDRSKIKYYSKSKTTKPNFTSNAPSKALTGWVNEFYRADAGRYRDLHNQLLKISNKIKVDMNASTEEFSKAFANAFNITNTNAQPIQNMLALMAPKGKKGSTPTGEDLAANLLATIGFSSDIYKNREFQKRFLEQLGIKYNAKGSTDISDLSKSIQNKLNKNDITLEDLLKLVGGDAKNTEQIVSNIAKRIGFKQTGYEREKNLSKYSILNKNEEKNEKQKALDNKAKQALIVLGGVGNKDSKTKNSTIESLQHSIMGSVGAVNASTETVRRQTKFSERLIGALGEAAKSFAAASLKSLVTTGLKIYTLFRTASALFGGMRWVKNNPIFKAIGGFINEWVWTPAKKFLIDPLISGIKSLMMSYIPPSIMEKISTVADSVVGFVSKWGETASTAMLSDDPQERRNARNQILSGIGSIFSGIMNKYVLPELWKIAKWLSLAFTGVKLVKTGASMLFKSASNKIKNPSETIDTFLTNRKGPFWDTFTKYYLGMDTGKNVVKAASKSTSNFLGPAVKATWKGAQLVWGKVVASQTGQMISSFTKKIWGNIQTAFSSKFTKYTTAFSRGGAKGLFKSIGRDILHAYNSVKKKILNIKDYIKAKIPATKKLFESIKNRTIGAYNIIKDKLIKVKDYIKSKIPAAKSLLKSIINRTVNAFNIVKDKLINIKDYIKSKIPAAKGLLNDIKSRTLNAFNIVKDKVLNIKNYLGLKFPGTKKFIEAVISDSMTLFNFVRTKFFSGINKVKSMYMSWAAKQSQLGIISPDQFPWLTNAFSKVANNKIVQKGVNAVKGSAVGKAVSKGFTFVKNSKVGKAVSGVASTVLSKGVLSSATSVLGSLVGLIGKAAAFVTPVGIAVALVAAGGWLIKKIIDCVFRPAAEKEGVSSKDAHGVGTAVCKFVSESVSKFFSGVSHFLDEFGGYSGLVKYFWSGMWGLVRGIWHSIAKAVGSKTDNIFSVTLHLAGSIAKGIWNLITDLGELLIDSVKALLSTAWDAAKGVFHFFTLHLFDDSKEKKEEKKANAWYENSIKDLFKKDENLKAELERRAGGDSSKMKDLSLMEKILGSSKVSRIKEVSKSEENREIASNYRFFEEREKKLAEKEAKEKEKQQKEKEEEQEDQDSFRDNVSSGLNSIKDYFNSGKLKKDITNASEKLGGFLKDTLSSIKNFDYAGVGHSIVEGAGGFTANFLSGIIGESETYDLFDKIESVAAERGYTELTRFAQKGKHTIASDITSISRFTGESTDRLNDIYNVLRDGVARGWMTEEETLRIAKNYAAGKSAREGKPKTEKKETTKTTVTETTNTILVTENAAKETKKTSTTATATSATTTELPTFLTSSTTKTGSSTSTSGSASTASSSKSDDSFWDNSLVNAALPITNHVAAIKGRGGIVGVVKEFFGFDNTPNRGKVAGKPISPVRSGSLTVGSGKFASGTVYASGLIIPSKYKNNVKLSGTYGERTSAGKANPGIDISKYPDDKGAIPTVIAPIGGVVKYVGAFAGLGRTVLLTHDINGQRYTTLYGHLASFAEGLKVGDAIAAGDLIGYMGTSDSKDYNKDSIVDNVYPRGLHFAVSKGNNPPINYSKSMDPVKFLNLVYGARNTAGTTTVSAGGNLVGYETADYAAKKPPTYGLAAVGDRGANTVAGANIHMTGELIKASAVEKPKSKLDENIGYLLNTEYFKNLTDEQKIETYNKIINDPEMLKLATNYDMDFFDRGDNWFEKLIHMPTRTFSYAFNAMAKPFRAKELNNLLKEKELSPILDPERRHMRAMLTEAGIRDYDKYIEIARGSDIAMDLVRSSLEKRTEHKYGFGEFTAESKKFAKMLEDERLVSKGMERISGTRTFDNLTDELKERFMEYAKNDPEMREALVKVGSNFNMYGRNRGAEYINELAVLADLRRSKDEAERNNRPEDYNDAVLAHMLRLGGGASEEDLPGLIEVGTHDKSTMAFVEDIKSQLESGKKFNEGEVRALGESVVKLVEEARLSKSIIDNNINTLINSDVFNGINETGLDKLKSLLSEDEVLRGIDLGSVSMFNKEEIRNTIKDRAFELGFEKYKSEEHPEISLTDDEKDYLVSVYQSAGGFSEEEAKKQISLLSGNIEAINKAKELAESYYNENKVSVADTEAFKQLTEEREIGEEQRKNFNDNLPTLFAAPEFSNIKEEDKPIFTEMLWRNQPTREAVISLNSGSKLSEVVSKIKSVGAAYYLNEDMKPVDTVATAEAAKAALEEGEEAAAKSTITPIPVDVKYMNAISDLLGMNEDEAPEALKIIKADGLASALLDEYIEKSEKAGGDLDKVTKLYYADNIYSILRSVSNLKKKTGRGGILEGTTVLPIAEGKNAPKTLISLNDRTDYESIVSPTRRFVSFDSNLASIVGVDAYKKIDDTLKKKLYEEPSVYKIVSNYDKNGANAKDLIVAAETAGIHMSTVFNDPEYDQLFEMLRRSEDVQGPVTAQAQLDAAERNNDLTEEFGDELNESVLEVGKAAKYAAGAGIVTANAANNFYNFVVLHNNQLNTELDSTVIPGGGGGGGPSGGGGFGASIISRR